MAKKKETPKVQENKQVPDYMITLNLGYKDILNLVAGDMKYADYTAEDGKNIRIGLYPAEGGVPVDVKLIDMFAERYEKLAQSMQKATDKLREKAEEDKGKLITK